MEPVHFRNWSIIRYFFVAFSSGPARKQDQQSKCYQSPPGFFIEWPRKISTLRLPTLRVDVQFTIESRPRTLSELADNTNHEKAKHKYDRDPTPHSFQPCHEATDGNHSAAEE